MLFSFFLIFIPTYTWLINIVLFFLLFIPRPFALTTTLATGGVEKELEINIFEFNIYFTDTNSVTKVSGHYHNDLNI